jgi:predicted nucleotidyltransferase
MFTQKEIIHRIEENREKIRSFGVRELILVGSYAKGEASEESDIDFVVEFEKGRGLFDDYVHLVQFLRDLFNKDVDVGEKHLIREELRNRILGDNKIEARI